MATPPPPNPPLAAVPLPAQPRDPAVQLPVAPIFPPSPNDVINAAAYRRRVDTSFRVAPLNERCTINDRYCSILYEHNVVTQAAAHADPQVMVPPWFHEAIQQLRGDIQNDIQQARNDILQALGNLRSQVLPSLKQLINLSKSGAVPLEVVPFTNGDDPTQPPHNLPHIDSAATIDGLNGAQLIGYLNGYGINPLPRGIHPHATNRARKETLKRVVGAQILDVDE
ncbi:hypothetical protein H4582DRAFT_2009491 [Lactarius indigo]|nr:hypothetical protein H4582DRAFT_2009491 [Lactarius indigo]